MHRRFRKEVASAGLPETPGPAGVVTSAELDGLPEPAQRYFAFMQVVGRPRDWSFRLAFTGRFRMGPEQRWMRCRTWQYNHRPALARIFHIRIRLGGVVPVIARDTYVEGRGRMLVRLLDLFTIADGKGEEYDIGELVTYLNDAVLIAPTMLLAPEVSFAPAGPDSFGVSLADHGRTVSAVVTVDEHGAPADFSTTDRFCADPRDPKRLRRARWTTPVSGWRFADGRPLFTSGQAIWHLAAGPFPYADFRPVPGSLAFNVAPGAV